MLKIRIPDITDLYDEKTEMFISIKGVDLQLEHSLLSLAKWERKWHKPFLGTDNKTDDEIRDYVKCMTITQNVNPEIYNYLQPSVLKEIFEYIEDPMTATWFSENEMKKSGIAKKEIITAEIIYYWMVTLGIPAQFEKWHLNSLLTLIRVINVKNTPPKKMSKKDILARNRQLNAARRAKHRTKG